MQNFISQVSDKFPPQRLKQQELLQQHTSFHTGGLAEYYCEANSLSELVTLISIARDSDVPVTLLGGGSFTLLSDNGVEGLVIKNNCRRFDIMNFQGKIRNRHVDVDRAFVYAESGALMNHVVRSALEQGFSGLEYALGLPGTVGGAVTTNAEYVPSHFAISDAVHKARLLTQSGEIKDVDASYFHFDQGVSNVRETGDILLSIMFVVVPGHKQTLWEKGREASSYRTEISDNAMSYGMTYRPITLDSVQTMLSHNSLPDVDQVLTHAEIPGLRKGDAQLSKHNPRFLYNLGNATTRDALALLHECKRIVKEKSGTSLSIQMGEIGV